VTTRTTAAGFALDVIAKKRGAKNDFENFSGAGGRGIEKFEPIS
jgi:hypothetical protein